MDGASFELMLWQAMLSVAIEPKEHYGNYQDIEAAKSSYCRALAMLDQWASHTADLKVKYAYNEWRERIPE